MWVHCCSPDKYGNYDGFSDDDSSVGSSTSTSTSVPEQPEPELTPAQQLTLFTLVTIPTLILVIVFFFCWWGYAKLRNRVPSYLSTHFPLYDTDEDIHINTPVLERRRVTSVPKQLKLLQKPDIVPLTPSRTNVLQWSSSS